MTAVCCPLSGGDGDGASVSRTRIQKARKQYRCYECGAAIEPGTRYEYTFGVWDGSTSTFATCLSCMEIRDHFSCGNGFVFGELWSDLENNFFPDMRAGGPCLDGLSPAGKARMFEERVKWLFEEQILKDGARPPARVTP